MHLSRLLRIVHLQQKNANEKGGEGKGPWGTGRWGGGGGGGREVKMMQGGV